MADEVAIDKQLFHNRLSAFITQWKADKRSGNHLFGDADSITIVMGKSDESQNFNKTSAVQFWLLGYEFPSTIFVITPESIYIVTTKKKGAGNTNTTQEHFGRTLTSTSQPPTLRC